MCQTDLRSVAKKIACDEAIFAPQLAFTYLASSAFIQEPGDWEGVRANVNDKVQTTVIFFLHYFTMTLVELDRRFYYAISR